MRYRCESRNGYTPTSEAGSNEIKKTLMELMPTTKLSDIDTLSKLINKKDLKEYLREHGYTDKD
jgi:hypothetical protein